ncbi:phosphoribosyltransferase (plasmid) [Variovorax sp. V59]|uniref:phosphoribosyltransferase n=1 Tax=unclassified Variovorax TaxID=663243 RepID=UPI00177C91F9|nr:phosphoribosyltransferase [Variovorax sp. VRV01]MBD9666909.1 phosphoribosyltransferase [Variovorax sp. VRV01]
MDELFEDRANAGRRLAKALRAMKLQDPVVFALPRGGVPVAAEVARALRAPLGLLLVRKIGAPGQPEVAVAAVAEGPQPIVEVRHDILRLAGASPDYVQGELPRHLEEIERRRRLYLQGRPSPPVQGRTAVLVDDGIATGTTVRAALRSLRGRHPSRIVLAVPVAPADELADLRSEVDDLVCLLTPEPFVAVGAYYRHFDQTTDAQVVALMARQR